MPYNITLSPIEEYANTLCTGALRLGWFVCVGGWHHKACGNASIESFPDQLHCCCRH